MDSKGPERRKSTAIKELAPNSAYHAEADGTIIEWLTPDVPQPSEADIDAKVAELKAEYDSQEYARQRAEAYPTWQEQMDLIYHKGVAGLKAELKKTKDKFSKE